MDDGRDDALGDESLAVSKCMGGNVYIQCTGGIIHRRMVIRKVMRADERGGKKG